MPDRSVIIFDGVCTLCNGAVNFIIKRDVHDRFVFAPLQSAAGQALLRQYGIEQLGSETFVLIKNKRCLLRTDAALTITKDLSGYWFLFQIFRIVPRALRDVFYRWLANHRYRLFGKQVQCRVPPPGLQHKFLN